MSPCLRSSVRAGNFSAQALWHCRIAKGIRVVALTGVDLISVKCWAHTPEKFLTWRPSNLQNNGVVKKTQLRRRYQWQNQNMTVLH